jgi:hypothetical protein
MQNSARRKERNRRPAPKASPWLAVFGAALTCIALAGIVAVAQSPRSLSGTAKSPVIDSRYA